MDDGRADVVFLGVGGRGNKAEEQRDDYYREIVEAVGARWVIPIHYYVFFLSLDDPLVPMRDVVDDFDVTMKYLIEKGGGEGGTGAGGACRGKGANRRRRGGRGVDGKRNRVRGSERIAELHAASSDLSAGIKVEDAIGTRTNAESV